MTYLFTEVADALPLSVVVMILVRGALRPPMRFSAAQSASPALGNTSGVCETFGYIRDLERPFQDITHIRI
jgi:hypothetical protein